MKERLNLKQIMRDLKTDSFFLNCKMPLEYTAGLPILQIKNEKLCLLIPYLKYKATGVVDKTKVYPIRYVIRIALPQNQAVGFEDLSYNAAFCKVDFDKAIGWFRHEAVKQYSKKEYKEAREKLFSMYDKMIGAILGEAEYTQDDEESFKELFNTLLEPSVKPIYKALDHDFYSKYCR